VTREQKAPVCAVKGCENPKKMLYRFGNSLKVAICDEHLDASSKIFRVYGHKLDNLADNFFDEIRSLE
jgi:hypothetical protein